jgi:phosphoribosylformylglycinamidine cyclo-ligase
MPGLYREGDYDLAGFALGAAERGALLPKLDAIGPGDVVLGLASRGAHANGYSLIRAIVARAGLDWRDPAPFAPGQTLAEALLAPTRIYVKAMLPLIRAGQIKGLAHITGGGLVENLPRAVPDHLRAHVDWESWRRPEVFNWLQAQGATPEADMRRTFNLGVGMAAIVAADQSASIVEALQAAGETVTRIGEIGAP